jgi:hypothetical protein
MTLSERWKRAGDEYASLKAECEREVVQWRWASWRMFAETPYQIERNRSGRGRWLSEDAAPPDGAIEYGFDARGRVVVQRQLVVVKGWPDAHYETFLRYDAGGIDGTHYGYRPKEPINVTRVTVETGRVTRFERLAKHGHTIETYAYRDGLPVEGRVSHEPKNGKGWTSIWTFAHDALGRVTEIRQNGITEYVRPAKSESIAALGALVEERLTAAIAERLQSYAATEPVCCVLVAYDAENPGRCLPPLLAIGTVRERDAWIAQHGARAKDYVWNPAEHAIFDRPELRLDDPLLVRTCELFTQEVAMKGKYAALARVLVRIAVGLNAKTWSASLNATEDFVIVPVDLECADVKQNLKAAVPATKLAAWRRLGLA